MIAKLDVYKRNPTRLLKDFEPPPPVILPKITKPGVNVLAGTWIPLADMRLVSVFKSIATLVDFSVQCKAEEVALQTAAILVVERELLHNRLKAENGKLDSTYYRSSAPGTHGDCSEPLIDSCRIAVQLADNNRQNPGDYRNIVDRIGECISSGYQRLDPSNKELFERSALNGLLHVPVCSNAEGGEILRLDGDSSS